MRFELGNPLRDQFPDLIEGDGTSFVTSLIPRSIAARVSASTATARSQDVQLSRPCSQRSTRSQRTSDALTTCTVAPLASESGGLEITRSFSVSAGNHLHFVAIVLAQDDRNQSALSPSRTTPTRKPSLRKISALDRHNQRARAFRNHEMHFGVSARAKVARCVVDIHFGEQRSRGGIDGAGGADQFAGKVCGREIPTTSDRP